MLGQQFLIVPYVGEAERKQPDIWKRAVDLFNRVGAQTASRRASSSRITSTASSSCRRQIARRQAAVRLPAREHRPGAREDGARSSAGRSRPEKDPVAYFNRLSGALPAGAREGLVEERRRRRRPTPVRSGQDTKFTGQMANVGAGLDRLEADLRAGREGWRQALHRRARQPEGAARRPGGQLFVSAESEFLMRGSGSSRTAASLPDDQLALHLLAAVVLRQVAVEAESVPVSSARNSNTTD